MRHTHHLRDTHNHTLYTICVLTFIYTLHATLPTYINSTFLNQYFAENIIGILYTIGSIISVLGFLFFYKIVSKFGNYKTSMFFIYAQILLLAAIIIFDSFYIVGLVFILISLCLNMIGLGIDIFLEKETDTRSTGGVRGLYLTVMNTAWVLGPLFAGALIEDENYKLIYLASLILILPFAYMVKKNFVRFVDPRYSHASLKATAHKVLHSIDLRNVFISNTILQTFYAWMVIYTPIYLNKYVGFSWDEIGIIFTIMLIPFVIMDYPLGKLADKKYGEKELMIIGFLILGVFTISLSFITNHSILIWAGVLFLTRVGAATAEMMIETYFFKRVPEKDLNVLGFFRITRPIAYIIAPLIAGLTLSFLSHETMFIILGIMCLSAILFIQRIADTN